MSKQIRTLAELLANTSDGTLLDIEEELQSGLVPATGATHSFCRKVNRLIDKGELRISPTSYRKVYLPTLAKAVHREMASRYTNYLKTQISRCSLVEGTEQAGQEAEYV